MKLLTVTGLSATILLSAVLCVSARSPPGLPECLALPCARPRCENYEIATITQNGRECPGCPVCPPDDNCANLDSCDDIDCETIFCLGATPTCGFSDNEFCQGCDKCPGCDTIQCPEPSPGCNDLKTLKMSSTGELCTDCQVCVDDFRHCPEISCFALPSTCPADRIKSNPIFLNGKVCLDCSFCQCPIQICPACETVDNWDSPKDENGCDTECPPCKVGLPDCPRWNRRLCNDYREVELYRGHICIGCPVPWRRY